MGENSQPNPESDVIFKKSLSIGLKKFSLQKKSQSRSGIHCPQNRD